MFVMEGNFLYAQKVLRNICQMLVFIALSKGHLIKDCPALDKKSIDDQGFQTAKKNMQKFKGNF